MEDTIADAEAVGDIVEHGADGSVTITPNPSMNGKERFRLLAERQLQRQRDREGAVMNLFKEDAIEQEALVDAPRKPA
jgi:hypothetical protein